MGVAQRRPERQPRLHRPALRRPTGRSRSLNEGRSVNPGYTASRRMHAPPSRNRSTKAGASTPATPGIAAVAAAIDGHAQRRPERQPRLHPGRADPSGHPVASLNEGRSVNPGYTRRKQVGHRGAKRSTKAGASTPATPGGWSTDAYGRVPAQRRPERQPRLHARRCRWGTCSSGTLNEGRSVNPGYTNGAGGRDQCRLPRSLNEGRSVNPGYTSSVTR